MKIFIGKHYTKLSSKQPRYFDFYLKNPNPSVFFANFFCWQSPWTVDHRDTSQKRSTPKSTQKDYLPFYILLLHTLSWH